MFSAERRQVQRHLTPEQEAEIVREYLEGKTVYALLVQYRVDDKTVIKRSVDAGVALRPAKHGLPTSELAPILTLRADGWSWSQIGERYDRSGTAIRKFVLRHDARSGSSVG